MHLYITLKVVLSDMKKREICVYEHESIDINFISRTAVRLADYT